MPQFALSGSPQRTPGADVLVASLAGLGIRVGTTPIALPAELEALRGHPGLDAAGQERLLAALDPLLAELGLVEPLRRRDLLQLRRGLTASEEHLARFARFHTHDDDEGRYVVAGSCVFGLALPGLGQLRLSLGPGDHLRIPAGTEHWFGLGETGHLQAVRLFSRGAAMATTYTGRPVQPLPG